MVRENVCVFSEPVMHDLDYASCFMKQLAEGARRADVVTVVETDGTASANDAALETYDPAVFYSVGHGQCCIHTVECMEPYIEAAGYHCEIEWQGEKYTYDCVTDRRLDFWVGRHVHLLSCVTGLNLGPELIRHGARSFIGYDHFFLIGWYFTDEEIKPPAPCEPPDEYGDMYTAIDSDVEGERAIVLRGASVGEAVAAMKAKFQEYIKKYTEGEWKDRLIAYWARTCLEHDLEHLVAYGDMDWRPCSAAAAPPPSPIPLFLLFVPFGFLVLSLTKPPAKI